MNTDWLVGWHHTVVHCDTVAWWAYLGVIVSADFGGPGNFHVHFRSIDGEVLQVDAADAERIICESNFDEPEKANMRLVE